MTVDEYLAGMLNRAIKIAVDAHYGQFDKAGAPYILHPLKVMYKLKTNDIQQMCIAILHDTVEDGEVTYDQLQKAGMSARVIDGVRALTKVPGETYEEYKGKVKANPDAILVKMQDLRHNSDLRRLKGVSQKDIARTVKYMEFYKELKEIVDAVKNPV